MCCPCALHYIWKALLPLFLNTEAVISSQLLLAHGRVSMQLYVNNLKLVYKWRNTAK